MKTKIQVGKGKDAKRKAQKGKPVKSLTVEERIEIIEERLGITDKTGKVK
jgi:hypothetical protein